MLKNHIWKIIGGGAVVLMVLAFMWAGTASEKANEGVEVIDHVKGNPDANVVLVEYSDFQCPACASFQPIISDILDQYGDSVRFEYRHFPLISIHPYAMPAAKAAEAAGQQGKFYEMHDKLFENQSVWSNSATPQAFFNQYAEDLELDVALFKQHMKSSILEDRIQDHFNEARERGLTGTPSFFLNGQRMQFETYEGFMSQIEAEITGVPVGSEVEVELGGDTAADLDVKFGI